MNGRRVAQSGEIAKPRLALPPQSLEDGRYLVDYLARIQGVVLGNPGDGIMKLKKIDGIPPKAPQAGLERRRHGVCDGMARNIGDPYFGRNESVGAHIFQNSPDVPFRFAVAIRRRGIEEIDPKLQRSGDRLLLLRRTPRTMSPPTAPQPKPRTE